MWGVDWYRLFDRIPNNALSFHVLIIERNILKKAPMAQKFLVKLKDDSKTMDTMAEELNLQGAQIEKVYTRFKLIRFLGDKSMLDILGDSVVFVEEVEDNFRTQKAEDD